MCVRSGVFSCPSAFVVNGEAQVAAVGASQRLGLWDSQWCEKALHIFAGDPDAVVVSETSRNFMSEVSKFINFPFSLRFDDEYTVFDHGHGHGRCDHHHL